MPEFEEKTEKATPRRRQKAREKGHVSRSREITSIAATAGIILIFYFAGNVFIKNMSALTSRLLGLQYGKDPLAVLKFTASETICLVMPFLGASFAFAMLTGAVQGGFFLKPLNIEIDRLDPLTGLKNKIFSRYSLVEFLKSLVKFILGGLIFYYVMKKTISVLPFITAMDIGQLQDVSAKLIARAVLYIFTIFLILAAVDYLYERWRFERSIKMSREELKEEYRETEGDPLIKSRIKSLWKELARRRMMQEVQKATVVITNPSHIAVALRYKKDEMSAPKVIAKGAGYIAEKIKEIARKYGIPIVEDKPLARALFKLKIDSIIPEELYKAVAKILAYIYKLRGIA
ncbi:MAG: flagellar biosynthesis protein FlhB [Nitrospirota bacterium]